MPCVCATLAYNPLLVGRSRPITKNNNNVGERAIAFLTNEMRVARKNRIIIMHSLQKTRFETVKFGKILCAGFYVYLKVSRSIWIQSKYECILFFYVILYYILRVAFYEWGCFQLLFCPQLLSVVMYISFIKPFNLCGPTRRSPTKRKREIEREMLIR